MNRTRAEFRATRELVGMSHALMADILQVKERSVARWEKSKDPDRYTPPQDAWDLLDEVRSKQRAIVEQTILNVKSLACGDSQIGLTYYPTENDYAATHPDEDRRRAGMENATARLIADALEREGYEVAFTAPDV